MSYDWLADELLPYFYDRAETLQEDCAAFMETELYGEVLEEIGQPELKGWLTPKRFKICATCGKPFISFDDRNRMKYCQSETYKRHKVSGEPFLAAKEGYSVCFMEARRVRRKKKEVGCYS